MSIETHIHCSFCGAAIATDQQIHYLKHGYYAPICEDCISNLKLIENIANQGQTG